MFSQTANATQLFEILGLEGEINLAISKLAEWAAPRPVNKNLLTIADDVYIQPEPLGVVLIIGAWNYPIAVTLQPLVGAIAAGKAQIYCLLRLSICHVIITMFNGKKHHKISQKLSIQLNCAPYYTPSEEIQFLYVRNRCNCSLIFSLSSYLKAAFDLYVSVGNAAVVKPSEVSSHTAKVLELLNLYLDPVILHSTTLSFLKYDFHFSCLILSLKG